MANVKKNRNGFGRKNAGDDEMVIVAGHEEGVSTLVVCYVKKSEALSAALWANSEYMRLTLGDKATVISISEDGKEETAGTGSKTVNLIIPGLSRKTIDEAIRNNVRGFSTPSSQIDFFYKNDDEFKEVSSRLKIGERSIWHMEI